MREHDGSREDRLTAVTEHALDLFWAAFADEYPEAKTGDIDPAQAADFELAACRAGQAWVDRNVPEEKPRTSYGVGVRVVFRGDVERYPHFIVPDGTEGTVIEEDHGDMLVKVDGVVPGLTDSAEWEGEFQWNPSNGDEGEPPFVPMAPELLPRTPAQIRARLTATGITAKCWEHFETDNGPEVERVDDEAPAWFTDNHAALLHRVECGCLVPEYRGSDFYQGRTVMPVPTFSATAADLS